MMSDHAPANEPHNASRRTFLKSSTAGSGRGQPGRYARPARCAMRPATTRSRSA